MDFKDEKELKNWVGKELLAFNDIKFDEAQHVYSVNGKRMSMSVTRLVDEYCHEFEKLKIATRTANKRGVPVEDILADWDYKGAYAREMGTHVHAYAENVMFGGTYELPETEYPVQEDYDKLTKVVDKFLEDSGENLIPLYSELRLYDEDASIAGTIDLLAYNKKSGKIEIWDWKTNKDIKFHSPNNQNMLGPFAIFPDTSYYHYSLQFSMYKALIERKTGIPVGDCYIVHLDRGNTRRDPEYKVYKAIDMSKTAGAILDARAESRDPKHINFDAEVGF